MKIDFQLSYIGQLEKKASKVSNTWEKMIEGTLCLVFFYLFGDRNDSSADLIVFQMF